MKFKSDIEIQAGVEAGGGTGSNGQVLSSTGSGVAWIDVSTGDVSGSGTTNNLTKWSSASTITDSLFIDDGSTITLSTNGGSNTFDLSHTSGGGVALNITKGGNGEALLIDKTSGSGNAISVTGDSYFNGDVGIGTETPGAKLDVDGTGIFSGSLTVGDQLNVGAQKIYFDESGVRSWGIQASGGNLNFTSGDNVGTAVFGTNISALNLSNTNTGDQDLSSYYAFKGFVAVDTDADDLPIGVWKQTNQAGITNFANAYGTTFSFDTGTYYGWQLATDSAGHLFNRAQHATWTNWLEILDNVNYDTYNAYTTLTATTRVAGDDTTNVATTEFVTDAVATGVGNYLPLAGGAMTGLISSYSTEALRIYSGSAYISGYATDGSVRNGYVQFSSNSVNIDSEQGSKYLILNTSGGNVGIGTTSPLAALQVNSITASTMGQVAGEVHIIGVNHDLSDTQMGTLNLTSTSRNTGASNQALGSSLTFSQNASKYVDGFEVVIGGIKTELMYTGNMNKSSIMNFYTHTNSGLTPKMSIDATGNVGIGTTEPEAKLEIKHGVESGLTLPLIINPGFYQAGTSSGIGFLTDGTASYTKGALVYTTTGSGWNRGDFQFLLRNDGNQNLVTLADAKMTIKASGDVGIGTITPQSKFQVAGGIQMADDTDTASAEKVGTMRYRTGTEYVEVTGTELVTNGDFATDTAWIKQNGSTISGDVANVIAKGSLTSTSGNWVLYQSGALAPSKFYKVVFDARQTTGTGSFLSGNGYANRFNQYITTSWVQYEYILPTNPSTAYGKSFIVFGGGTLNDVFEVDNVSIIEVTEEDASYADMCMQTGASTYEWVNIVRNTY